MTSQRFTDTGGQARSAKCSSLVHVYGRPSIDTLGCKHVAPPLRCSTPGSVAHQQSQKRAATARAPVEKPRWWLETAAAPTPGPAHFVCGLVEICGLVEYVPALLMLTSLYQRILPNMGWCSSSTAVLILPLGRKQTLSLTDASGDTAGLAAAAPLLPAASPA